MMPAFKHGTENEQKLVSGSGVWNIKWMLEDMSPGAVSQ